MCTWPVGDFLPARDVGEKNRGLSVCAVDSLPGLSFSEFLSHVLCLNVVMKGSLSLFSLSIKHAFHQSTFLDTPFIPMHSLANDAYSIPISG